MKVRPFETDLCRDDESAVTEATPLTAEEYEDTKHKVEKYARGDNMKDTLDIPFLARFCYPAFSIFRGLLKRTHRDLDKRLSEQQATVNTNSIAQLNAQASFRPTAFSFSAFISKRSPFGPPLPSLARP